jgi:hypothetical protein
VVVLVKVKRNLPTLLTVETVIVLPPVTADVGTVMPALSTNVTVVRPAELSTVNSKEVPWFTAPPSCVTMLATVGKVMLMAAKFGLVII